MKKNFLYIFAATICLVYFSCIKKSDDCTYTDLNIKAPDAEVTKIEEYLNSKNITATKDAAGFYYIVNDTGTGLSPDVCSIISVKYTGTLVTDSIFDKTTGDPAIFRLGQLIPGWQKGLPHLKVGGKMKLFIPPSLGYGYQDVTRKDNQGNTIVVVPANSILIFDLELVSVHQ
ncbi:MAG: FKBP-type peptidyl-prolyl cis-trans isomerase [Bacteroidetes bacterium]|nr:FKBP-type peptidyl-prolyl cis-trans isomerase [Bacteroidota bacterium]